MPGFLPPSYTVRWTFARPLSSLRESSRPIFSFCCAKPFGVIAVTRGAAVSLARGFGVVEVVVGLVGVGGSVAPTRFSAGPVRAHASPVQPVIARDVTEAATATVIGPPSNTNSHFAPGASGFIGTQTFSHRTWKEEPPAGVYCSRTVPAWIVQTLPIVHVSPALTVKPPARLPVTFRRCVPR